MLRFHGVWMVALAACLGEATPVEKCDDLVDLLCERATGCVGISHAMCVQAAQGGLPCGSAKAVTASYDRCMDQLATHSCPVLFPLDQNGQPTVRLPADCMGVVLTRTATANPPFSLLSVPSATD